jgi:orotidine-5'-phosphate decarboxylase
MNPIFVAIDTTDLIRARDLAATLAPHVGGIKLGLEFFLAHGAEGVAAVRPPQMPLFLDLKLHDIPNTVVGALQAIVPVAPTFVTIHASGGPEMMRKAADTATEAGIRLLGVTVLTSMDDADLRTIGQKGPVGAQVLRLAHRARDAGVAGVICAPHEVAALRLSYGPDFVLMVPGIRPAWAEAGDQKRITTPAEALAGGANHLVIGRPITAAADPVAAVRRILDEI